MSEKDRTTAPAIRIFACVGRACREAGAAVLIDSLRRAIAAVGPAGAGLDVKACGCLGQCQDGPVAIAYGGKAARAQRPPRGEGTTAAPLATFHRVTAEGASRIVSRLIGK